MNCTGSPQDEREREREREYGFIQLQLFYGQNAVTRKCSWPQRPALSARCLHPLCVGFLYSFIVPPSYVCLSPPACGYSLCNILVTSFLVQTGPQWNTDVSKQPARCRGKVGVVVLTRAHHTHTHTHTHSYTHTHAKKKNDC